MYTLEHTEETITHEQSIETGNIGYTMPVNDFSSGPWPTASKNLFGPVTFANFFQ
jgi:hypothetical protein